MHLVRAHLGEELTPAALAQLRALGKGACQICSSIRARSNVHCSHCGCATPTRPLALGDKVPDRRRGRTQQEAPGNVPPQEEADPGDTAMEADDGEAVTAPIPRQVTASPEARQAACGLASVSMVRIPVCVATRLATTWAEALEGCYAGDEAWAFLARHRCRMLLGPIPQGLDTNTELKHRLQLWEQGSFDALLLRVRGQQSEMDRRSETGFDMSDEGFGRRAKKKAAAGATSKAIKGLVGGVAEATPEKKLAWTQELIPRSAAAGGPCSTSSDLASASEMAWGEGDAAEAKKAMR